MSVTCMADTLTVNGHSHTPILLFITSNVRYPRDHFMRGFVGLHAVTRATIICPVTALAPMLSILGNNVIA